MARLDGSPLNAAKFPKVADPSATSRECPGGQLGHHERLIWHCVFTAQTVRAGRPKPEAWVELRVADHHDQFTTLPRTLPKPRLDKFGADAAALQLRSL
jgi:hypothetical protein